MDRKKIAILIALTPVFIIISHYLAILPHIYAHISMANFLGYHQDVLGVHYSSNHYIDRILLFTLHGDINYQAIHVLGQPYFLDIALIALSGPLLANGLLYLLSLLLLKVELIRKNNYLFYFIFWFSFINMCSLFGYIPIRTFSTQGDMADIARGLTVTPWFIYVTFGYLIAFFIWNFFTNTLIQAFIILEINKVWLKASLMILCTFILFALYGTLGFFDNGNISHFLSLTSLILIPGWIIACWPTRNWVKRQMELPRITRRYDV